MDIRTIAGDDEELIVLGNLMNGDIGVGCNDLLLGSEFGALLEFEITDGAGQGQIAVNPSKIDETACRAYTRFLAYGIL